MVVIVLKLIKIYSSLLRFTITRTLNTDQSLLYITQVQRYLLIICI